MSEQQQQLRCSENSSRISPSRISCLATKDIKELVVYAKPNISVAACINPMLLGLWAGVGRRAPQSKIVITYPTTRPHIKHYYCFNLMWGFMAYISLARRI